LLLFVTGALTVLLLLYWLLQGKRGALLAMMFAALLLYGTQLAQTLDPSNLNSVRGAFLFGVVAAGVAVLIVWLVSWFVDTIRERRKARS
jgi:hypothetical protein